MQCKRSDFNPWVRSTYVLISPWVYTRNRITGSLGRLRLVLRYIPSNIFYVIFLSLYTPINNVCKFQLFPNININYNFNFGISYSCCHVVVSFCGFDMHFPDDSVMVETFSYAYLPFGNFLLWTAHSYFCTFFKKLTYIEYTFKNKYPS